MTDAVPNPTKFRVDRHALHEFLWRKADRRHVVRFEQAVLAEQIGVNKWTMNRIVNELIKAKRMKKVADTVGAYIVRDPAPWREQPNVP